MNDAEANRGTQYRTAPKEVFEMPRSASLGATGVTVTPRPA